MKTYIILLTLCLSSVSHIFYGQSVGGIFSPNQTKYTVLDSANFKFTYEYTYIQDVNKPNSPIKDQLYLLVGNNVSKFCNTTFLKKDHDGLETRGGGKAMAPGEGLSATEVFKDLQKKKETVTTHLTGSQDIFYVYNEELYQQTWRITSDTATILTYPCMKATTEYGGRSYTAWFTIAIPINNGPWKFGGLPGMILKVTDNQNYFSFVCTGVEVLKKKEPIVKFDGDYVSTSRKNISKLIKQMHQNFRQYSTAMGNIYVGHPSKKKTPPKPYNPIELE